MPSEDLLAKLQRVRDVISKSGVARVTFGPRKEFFINVVTEKRGVHEISLTDFEQLAAHDEGVRTATLLCMKYFGATLKEIAPPNACGCAPAPEPKSPPRGVAEEGQRAEPSVGFGFLSQFQPPEPKRRNRRA